MFNVARSALGWRATQHAGVQIIYLLRLVILARLLTPEAFGQLAIAMLIVTTLLSLTDFGVIPALVRHERLTREQEDAGWTVGVFRALAIALVIVVTAPLVAAWFGDPSTTRVIQLLAFRPILMAVGSIGIVRLTRELRFREQALIQLPGALVDLVAAVALAVPLGVWALVIGSLAGAAATSAASYLLAPHRPRLVMRTTATRPLIQFGRWVLGTSVIGLIASSGIQFVISRRLGVAELGVYYLAAKVAFLPADAATSVVGGVAFPLYASLQRDIRQTLAALRAFLSLLGLVLFPAYALMIALAPSFAEGLGPRWSGTAPLIQVMGLAAALGVYADAALPLLMARGRPRQAMVVVGVQTAALFAVLFPLVTRFGATGAAAAWLPAYVAAMAVSLWFVRTTIGQPLAGAGRQLFAIAGLSVSGAMAAFLMRMWADGLVALAAGLLIGLVTAGVLLAALSRRIHFDFRAFLRAPLSQIAS